MAKNAAINGWRTSLNFIGPLTRAVRFSAIRVQTSSMPAYRLRPPPLAPPLAR